MSTTVPGLENALGFDIVEVNPELAERWLQANVKNRQLRPRAIADYARDMAQGQWTLNGETIKFDVKGQLLDGQHRLLAVIESQATVRMLVVTGLPEEAQDTVDTGRRRTPADTLALHGEKNTTVMAAVLRRLWMWERGDHKMSGNAVPTVSEQADFLARHPDEVRAAVDIAVSVRQGFKRMPAAPVGVAAYLFNEIDPVLSKDFFGRLSDGAGLDQGHPVLALRNRVLNEGVRMPASWHVSNMIRAWNALREGRKLERISFKLDSDMPQPR